MEFKKCKHCGVEKKFDEYQKAGGGKWLQPYCKPCDSERKRKHSKANVDIISKRRHEYYIENRDNIIKKSKERAIIKRDEILKRQKNYRIKNREKVNAKGREYSKKMINVIREKRRERVIADPLKYKGKYVKIRDSRTDEQNKRRKEQAKLYRLKNKHKYIEYRIKNKEKTRERSRIYNNQKSSTDIEFRILKNLRSRTRFALKKWNTIKSDRTENLLGCTIPEFREYFTSLFTDGMTWEKFMNGEIHIDHIKPCSKFDLRIEEEQIACFNYKNLQPLWRLDNLTKGTTYKE